MVRRVTERKFPISIVDDHDLPGGAVHDEHIDTDDCGDEYRWCVFEHEGRLWGVGYTATVNDGIYWGDLEKRPEEIECVEVRPVPKTITVYEPVVDEHAKEVDAHE